MGHLQEPAVADGPGDARDPCSELPRAPDRPEVRVEDMVPVVRLERLAALLAQLDLRAEALECRGRVLPAERMDLHGQGRLRAEAAHELRVVDDHDEPLRRRGDDLLAEQGAAHPLNQVELRVDLVCAVDGQVEPEALLQGGQWDPQPLRLLCGRERRGHAFQIHPVRNEAADAREEVPRRRSGAEAEDHARLHVREGGLGRVPLQLVPGGHSQALRRSSSTSFTSSPITRSSSFSPSAFDALDGSPVTPDQYFRGSATTAYRGISFFPGGLLPFTRSGRAVMIREVSPAPAWPSPSGRMPCDA